MNTDKDVCKAYVVTSAVPQGSRAARLSVWVWIEAPNALPRRQSFVLPVRGTNNQAELVSVPIALRAAHTLGYRRARIYTSSTVAANAFAERRDGREGRKDCAVTGSARMIDAFYRQVESDFDEVSVEWIRSEDNPARQYRQVGA